MKKLTALVLALAMALTLVACGGSKTPVTLATGGTSGTYYAVGTTLASTLGTKLEKSDLTAIDSGASKANVQLVNAGDAQMSILQSDVLNYAHNGTGGETMFEGAPVTDSLWVAGIYIETVQVVAKSDITDISQLRGKTVCVGDVGSGTALNSMQVLEAYGMTFDDIEVYYGSFSDGCEALKNGQIDAAINTAGAPTGAITDLSSTYNFNLLPIGDAEYEYLTTTYPFLVEDVVPAGTYSCVTEDVRCVGVKAVLVASANLSDDVVYELVKAMFDNITDLQNGNAKFKSLTLEGAIDGSFDLHPGAEKYYKEMGIL